MAKSKKHNIIVRIILILIAAYFIVDIFGGYAIETIIKNKLHSYINNTPDRLYDISYRTINISIADRAVRLGKISIMPRMNAIDSMKKNKVSMLVSFKADTFYFDGLSFFKMIVFNKIKLENIVSNNPVIKMYFNPKAPEMPKESGISANIINEKLKHANIKYFKIENGNLYIIRIPSKDSIWFRINSSHLLVKDIQIWPKADIVNKVKYESLDFTSNTLYGGFVKNYDIKADSISINSKERSLHVSNFSFMPKTPVKSYKKIQFARDVFFVNSGDIIFKEMDFHGKKYFNGFHTSYAELDGFSIKVSTDKRLPKNMNRKPLIGEMIKKVPIPIYIDTLAVKNNEITYNEIVSADKIPLHVFFTKADLKISNITNIPDFIKKEPELKIAGGAKFLDAGDLNIDIRVPLNSKEDKMIVSGHLGPTHIEPINKMLEGPLSVRFTSGRINSVDMNFIANTSHASGKLMLDYSDLTIQLFKDKETASKGVKEKHKWFINAIANGIIKKNNNKDSTKFVTGIIDYERPKDIGIPGYLFRSIKSGLISTFKPGTRRKAVKEVNQEKREELKEEKQEIKSKKQDAKPKKKKKNK